ncbi:hypothetical protein BDB01DRAFT_754089 [Pilobolus umbonatus]|nr:hypothetical protein BDB01DRAFT_754089 [Pilobolus umbonatus]
MTNSTSDNKPSVVDDFFSALFANQTSEPVPSHINSVSDVNNYEAEVVQQEEANNKGFSGVKRERILDEFDEYSLLSKRKNIDNPNGSRRQARNKRFTPAIDSPQILSKRSIDWNDVTPESRMLVRQIPKYIEKQDLMDYFSRYGEVVEVVFKNTFGFVQFENARSCAHAVQSENGKEFKGVILDLEVCRRKPYFAREEPPVDTTEQRKPRARNPVKPNTPNISNTVIRPFNHKDPKNNYYNGNKYDNNKNDVRRNNRRQDDSYKNTSNVNRNDMKQPKYDPRKPGISASNGYNQLNKRPLNRQSVDLPKRINNVPIVQIIISGDVSRNYINFIEHSFKAVNITVDAMTLPYNTSREGVVKQLVVEGVKAIILITRELETQSKVNLQLFSPNTTGEGVKYDEYDGITVNEAIIVVRQSQPTTITPSNNYPSTTSGYDVNTLSTLFNIMQASSSSMTSSRPSTMTPIEQPIKPTIPQLLATLVSGLGNTPHQSPSSISSIPAPPPVVNEQPSIAALLSTVANGNPVLSQMLSQISSPSKNYVPATSAPSYPPTTNTTHQSIPPSILNNNQLRDILSNLHTLSYPPTTTPSVASTIHSEHHI